MYSEDTSNLESLDMSLSINISENEKKEEVTLTISNIFKYLVLNLLYFNINYNI